MWLSPCYARRVLLHSGLYCLFWKVSSHIIVVVTSNSENWTSKNRVYYIPSFCREGHFSVIWKLSTSQHFPTYQQHSRVLFGEKRHWGFLQGGIDDRLESYLLCIICIFVHANLVWNRISILLWNEQDTQMISAPLLTDLPLFWNVNLAWMKYSLIYVCC